MVIFSSKNNDLPLAQKVAVSESLIMLTKDSWILLVDDSETSLSLMRGVLTSLGFEHILEAQDGEQALLVLKESLTNQREVALILADLMMPKVSGMDFVKSVRSDERFKATPFLLFSANAEMETIVEAVAAGVNSYLVKPITQKGLEQKLAPFLKK